MCKVSASDEDIHSIVQNDCFLTMLAVPRIWASAIGYGTKNHLQLLMRQVRNHMDRGTDHRGVLIQRKRTQGLHVFPSTQAGPLRRRS